MNLRRNINVQAWEEHLFQRLRFVMLVVVFVVGCGGDNGAGQVTADPHRFDIVENQTSDFGMNTPGGRGGRIIRVTTLASSGPGSLRDALEASGPRIVVFEVGGVIDLNKRQLAIREPFITVAGQTAPSPGITIIRGGLSIRSHDVIVKHLRVRPGDAGEAKRSGWEPDGIGTANEDAFNIVVDHCSISWAVDENLSASGARTEGPEATSRRVTFSNCIIAEGLDDASHSKGPHSKGSLIHDFCREIAVIGNLYAHNVQRNPYFKAFTTGVIVNNVIYNPGSRAVQVNFSNSEWEGVDLIPQACRISVVGNVMIHGGDTRAGLAMVSTKGDVYLEDNIAMDQAGGAVAVSSIDVRILSEKPMWGNITPMPSSTVVDHVAQHAGARPKDRDVVDERIIREFLAREGRVIDSQEEVGGYPQVEIVRRPLNVPANVDAWLAQLAAEIE